jgi:hypothetical protein
MYVDEVTGERPRGKMHSLSAPRGNWWRGRVNDDRLEWSSSCHQLVTPLQSLSARRGPPLELAHNDQRWGSSINSCFDLEPVVNYKEEDTLKQCHRGRQYRSKDCAKLSEIQIMPLSVLNHVGDKHCLWRGLSVSWSCGQGDWERLKARRRHRCVPECITTQLPCGPRTV